MLQSPFVRGHSVVRVVDTRQSGPCQGWGKGAVGSYYVTGVEFQFEMTKIVEEMVVVMVSRNVLNTTEPHT